MTVTKAVTVPQRQEIKGFGAPKRLGAHLFIVTIPQGRGGEVRIAEYFGFAGDQDSISEDVNDAFEMERVLLPRDLWSKVSDEARIEFNSRLKAQSLPSSRWSVGENFVEKLLGRELCVLSWAAEHVSLTDKDKEEKLSVIASRWASLRPEERWWLFSVTAGEAGASGESDRGWRKALYFALSDGAGRKAPKKKVASTKGKTESFDLFALDVEAPASFEEER